MSEGPIMSTFGIVLLLLGAALAATEAHVPSHGALGSAAAVAVAAGIALVVAGAGLGTAAALIVGLAAGIGEESGPGSPAVGVGPRLDLRAAGAVFERLGGALDARV
jgi:hypothetical protein